MQLAREHSPRAARTTPPLHPLTTMPLKHNEYFGVGPTASKHLNAEQLCISNSSQ